MLSDGETGYLVPHGDAAALAEKVILHFPRASFERRQMRQRCAAHATDHLDFGQYLSGIHGIYQEIVNGP